MHGRHGDQIQMDSDLWWSFITNISIPLTSKKVIRMVPIKQEARNAQNFHNKLNLMVFLYPVLSG